MPLTGAERTARYRAKNRVLCLERTKKWAENNPIKYKQMKRRNHLKREYGITPEQYAAMWKDQGFVCAICGRDDPADHKKGWHLDHCHKTKMVRAILCGHCNRMLGGALDNANTLKSAIKYLERFSDQHQSMIKSGNDGHRVRERPRSVADAIAFRWPA